MLIPLIIISLFAEDRFLSRPTMVANAFSIFIATAHDWGPAGWLLQTYATLGLLIGITAFFSYMLKQRLTTDYYRFSFYMYHTIIALIYVFVAGLVS